MPYSERYGSIEDIGEKTDNRCHICHEEAHPDDYGSPAGPLGREATTVDHLVPQSEGGSDEPENLLLAHARCNSSRGTRAVEDARLEWAGTPEKPLSTSEKWELVQLAVAESRQRRRQGFGIAAVVGLGVLAVGGLVWWWLAKRDGKSSQKNEEPIHTPPSAPSTILTEAPGDMKGNMQIDRKTFEQVLLTHLETQGELNSTQQRILSQLDQAELVTVAGHDREGLEVWIPNWDTIIGSVRAELPYDDVTLHVSEPEPNGQAQSDPRMDVVERRPLFG